MSEKFIRYSTDVETMTDAFAFIMEHVDEFPKPNIAIEAVTHTDEDDRVDYAVAVYGVVA